ncbi:MAG: phage tail protein [Rubrivivax sp.]|nr:MAG: phage tail protein [Rubrivivax sp.]
MVLGANVPTGTVFAVATVFAAAKTVTVVTNATSAVVTAVAHGYSNGDLVVFPTSGWGRLYNRAFEVSSVTTDTFVIKLNTADTNVFPAGSGIGTVKKVSTLVQLTKLMNPSTSGGDPKTINYKFLDSDVDYSINDGFNATGYTLQMDDDDTTAGYTALESLTDTQIDTVLKMTMRNGSRVYIPGRVALNSVPNLTEGQINSISVAFNGNGRHTRYSA